jgi:hypothetical protein
MNVGIVPNNAVLVAGSVEVAALVEELDGIAQRQKSVSKSRRDKNLVMVVRGEADAGPFAEMGRASANIHGHIKGFAFDDAAKLGLRMVGLLVQAAQRAPYRARMVIPHKLFGDAQRGELAAMIGLHEKAASIAKDFGTKLEDAGKRGFDSLHWTWAPAKNS